MSAQFWIGLAIAAPLIVGSILITMVVTAIFVGSLFKRKKG